MKKKSKSLPLVVAFWGIYIFAFNIVFGTLIVFLTNSNPNIFQPLFSVGWAVATYLTWMSTINYKGKKMWTIITKIIMLLQGIGVLGRTFGLL